MVLKLCICMVDLMCKALQQPLLYVLAACVAVMKAVPCFPKCAAGSAWVGHKVAGDCNCMALLI